MSVYRMSRYTLATSIFNRFTGAGLSLSLVLLVYWLTSVAGGPLRQARAARLLGSLPAKVIYAACIVAFCYHLVAGIRHLVWDTGRGLERSLSRKSARLVVVVSVALMLIIGYCVFLRSGQAA